jgi:hypothetical protein
LRVAADFYGKVVEIATEKVAVQLLEPFVQSPMTFRFIESVFSRFWAVLATDPRFAGPRIDLIMATGHLLHLLADGLPLLPKPVSGLFVQIQKAKWRTVSFQTFFLQSFFEPLGIEWVSAGAPIILKFVKSMLEFIRTDSHCSEFLNILFRDQFPGIELPSLYESFGLFYVEYFVSIHDIRLLTKVLQASRLLPETVCVDDILKLPEHYDPGWYTCSIYPHTSGAPVSGTAPLLFGTGPQVQFLEKLVDFQLQNNALSEWLAVVRQAEEFALAPQVAELVAHPSEGFPSRYRWIMETIGIPRLAKRVWLGLVEANLGRWTGILTPVLKHLSEQFGRLKASQSEFVELRVSLREASQNVLDLSLSTLNALEMASVSDQFTMIVTVMDALYHMQIIEKLNDAMYGVVVRKLSTGYILSAYMVLNSFAMRIPAFANLCTDAENRSWLRLESVILYALHQDQVFLKAFIELQDTFSELAERDINEASSNGGLGLCPE